MTSRVEGATEILDHSIQQDLHSLRGRKDIRFVADLVATAEQQLNSGSHLASIGTSQRVQREFVRAAPSYLNSWATVMHARNLIHLGEDAKAVAIVSSIPLDMRRDKPDIDYHVFTVFGLAEKRKAHTLWKNGKLKEATAAVIRSLEAFEAAQTAATLGSRPLLALNAQLNDVYARGLQAAILGRSKLVNPLLVIRVITLEREIRSNSSPRERDDLTALIMIADLAAGAELSLADVYDLVRESSFTNFSPEILPVADRGWAIGLLRSARDSIVRPEIIARALVLAGRFLISHVESVDESVVLGLRDRLLHTIYDAQSEVQSETFITRSARRMIEKLSDLTDRPFLGRRSLR